MGVPPPIGTSRTTALVDAALPDAGEVATVGFVAPGGGGAGEVLAAIALRVTELGGTALRMTGRRLERNYLLGALADVIDLNDLPQLSPATIDGETERRCRDRLLDRLADADGATLLVDDAQWLDEATLRVLVGVIERAEDRGVSVIVAHRPRPGDPDLAALDAALSRGRPLAWLGPLTEQEVAERSALLLGRAVDPAFVETLHDQTAGVSDLVDRLTRTWGGSVPNGTSPSRGDTLPSPVVESIRTEVDQLPQAAQTVLAALSAGADLDDDLLVSITGLSRTDLSGAFEMLRSAGLLLNGADEVVPVIAAAVLELTPVAHRRRFHAALADALSTRGAPPARAAEHLAAADVNTREAAQTYLAAGEACLADAPELARRWFERAQAAGATSQETAARLAEASAMDGDSEAALKLADSALADSRTVDRDRALAVVAGLLPSRGFWKRAAGAYGELADHRVAPAQPLAVIGSVVAGQKTTGENLHQVGSLELEALTLAARGLTASLDGLDFADTDQPEAPFLEAAELLESAHNLMLLPDSPHAIGATVALAMCELPAAEHLLNRAIERDVGGKALQARHRLLLGWVAVRAGRWSAAEAALAETKDETLAPRELLLAAAIDAGLARRGGDLTRLRGAWQRAEGALLRYSADLLSMDALGELAIAASRLGCWDQISGKARELGNVLRSLGEPPLWVLPLRWTGLQVALASDDQEAVTRRAEEVAAVDPVHPRLAALADAAASWVEVMAGRIDPDTISSAAKGLQDLSLTWEASRLVGQAAIRSGDPSMTRSLLEQARDLKATLPSAEPDSTPTAASVLSDREQMVAQHIVDGLTYKEIGAQLYISPKTVEHHVAKIRQKLGAGTRAEMLAALRTQLG
jgi:DNA-binding CsgD family transcriptional regulator/tetratricopeptide (TPR) repeat protein